MDQSSSLVQYDISRNDNSYSIVKAILARKKQKSGGERGVECESGEAWETGARTRTNGREGRRHLWTRVRAQTGGKRGIRKE